MIDIILKSFFKICKGLLIAVFVFYICGVFECSQDQNILELINRLDSSYNVIIKSNASEELYTIGKPSLESLFYALKHKNRNIRKEIPRVLAWIRDPSVINPLINALHDNDFQVTLAVEDALEMLEGDAIEPLIPLLESSDDTIKIRAIHIIGEIALKLSYKSEILLEERKILNFAVPALTALLESQNPVVKLNTLWTLRLIKDPRPVGAILRLLEDNNFDVRIQAIRTLGVLGDYPAVEGLIEILRDTDCQVRIESATSLGRIRNKQAVLPLIECLEDKDWRVRYRAITSLGMLKDKRAIDPLINLFKKENDPVIKRSIMHSLGDIANDAHTVDFISSVLSDKNDFLYRVLGEKDNFIQQNAVYSLGKIGKPAVGTLLKMLKQTDSDAEYLRADVIEALGNIKDPRALEPIIGALWHNNWEVRLSAVTALEKFNNKRAFEAIYMALWDKNREVRRQAIYILAEAKYCRAYNALKTISETDRDHSIRSSAKDALKILEEKVFKKEENFTNGKKKLLNVCTCSGDGETVIEKRYFDEEEKLIKIEDLVEHSETRFFYFPKEALKGYMRAIKHYRLEKIYGDQSLFYGNLLKDGVRMETGYMNGQFHGKVMEWDLKGIIKKHEIWEIGRLIKKLK
ncbi:MAG: hypothetical protein QG657_840 [Acidobacteriota bacterium]|nr:hypothetical protein [Acidobacteriota bacterium]